MVVVEGVVDPLAEPGADLRPVAVLDRLDHEVPQAPLVEDIA